MDNTELRHTCRACGAQYWDFDLPRGRDPWTTDAGALAYCDACGDVDNFTIEEVQYADN